MYCSVLVITLSLLCLPALTTTTGGTKQCKSHLMICARISLKFGSEIVINSAFVILLHTIVQPTMNFPSANADKSLFQWQGNFLIIGHISKNRTSNKSQVRDSCSLHSIFYICIYIYLYVYIDMYILFIFESKATMYLM